MGVKLMSRMKGIIAAVVEYWRDTRENRTNILMVVLVGAGAVLVIAGVIALALAYYFLLPGLFVMVAAWAAHHVWDAVPALGYWYSVLAVVALRVVAWLIGQFFRQIIVSAVGGKE